MSGPSRDRLQGRAQSRFARQAASGSKCQSGSRVQRKALATPSGPGSASLTDGRARAETAALAQGGDTMNRWFSRTLLSAVLTPCTTTGYGCCTIIDLLY